MLRRFIFILSIVALLLSNISTAQASSPDAKIKRVIYITFDGTRWQDIYLDHARLKKFWEKYAKDAVFYGMPDTNTTMEVASIPVSLPSYQSQMTGAVQPCNGNSCGRTTVETLPETLVHRFGFKAKDVAIFSSWDLIGYSAEHIENTTFTNLANQPLYDPDTKVADAFMQQVNIWQEQDKADFGVRYDKYTFMQALHYLQVYQPKFMWMSFNDSDEAAHKGDLEEYHSALAYFDDVLDTILTELKRMKIDKETMVIVTTDHGRGDGDNWKHHGAEYPESKRTWAFVINGELKPVSQTNDVKHYSTLSIRPTIESVLG